MEKEIQELIERLKVSNHNNAELLSNSDLDHKLKNTISSSYNLTYAFIKELEQIINK